MVASDTVVGIVGSVLLVGVMVGVFVYEYNNPAGTEGPGTGGAFADAYPYLDATQDIDGDGKPNSSDDDLDGDGHPNAQDRTIGVTVPVSGTTPGPGPTDLPGLPGSGPRVVASVPVLVGEGFAHLNGTVTYTVSAPPPAPAAPGLSVALLDSSGSEKARAASEPSGSTITFTLEATDLAPGNYTVQVTQTSPGPATGFSGAVQVHYETRTEQVVPVK